MKKSIIEFRVATLYRHLRDYLTQKEYDNVELFVNEMNDVIFLYYGVVVFYIRPTEFTPSLVETWAYIITRFIHSNKVINNKIQGKI